MMEVRNVKNRKILSVKTVLIFLIYEILFIGVTSPFILLFGPFTSIKKAAVSTVMATRHQYLVTTFLSQGQIDKIVGKVKETAPSAAKDQDIERVQVQYKDDREITQYDVHSTRFDGYILEIKDPTRIRVAYTKKLGKEGQKTSEMAEDKKAIAAINGGAFVDKSSNGKTFSGTGALPGGFVISDGNVVYSDCSDNTDQNVVAFTKEGRLIVGDHSLNDLKKLNVKEAICFRRPTLIIDGQRQIMDKECDGLNPRTAVGQKADGTVIFLVVDGRKSITKLGASLYDLQELLLQHGAVNAGNLDGGYSSTMYYDGEIINSPNEWDGERSVATALYVEP